MGVRAASLGGHRLALACAIGSLVAAWLPSPGLFVALGLGMTASTLLWPKQCYPFVWTGLVFLLEPVCLALGRRSRSQH